MLFSTCDSDEIADADLLLAFENSEWCSGKKVARRFGE